LRPLLAVCRGSSQTRCVCREGGGGPPDHAALSAPAPTTGRALVGCMILSRKTPGWSASTRATLFFTSHPCSASSSSLTPSTHTQAGLQVQPWDGMLKHYALGPRRPHLLALRQGLIADMATPYLGHPPRGPGAADAAAALAAAAAQLAASSSSSGSGEGGGTSAGGGVDASRLHAEAAAAITQGSRFQWDWGQLVNTRPPPPAASAAAAAAAAGKKEA
jgi:hypothetical protein